MVVCDVMKIEHLVAHDIVDDAGHDNALLVPYKYYCIVSKLCGRQQRLIPTKWGAAS